MLFVCLFKDYENLVCLFESYFYLIDFWDVVYGLDKFFFLFSIVEVIVVRIFFFKGI